MSNALLSYIVRPHPDPIQVSHKTGSPSLAALTIVVSNDTGKMITCKSISFIFMEGTNARDFFADATGISTSAPTGWSLTQQGAIFTATPKTPHDSQIGPDGVTFTISSIKVNQQPGTTEMRIAEVTASNTGQLKYPLAKFPREFEVGSLTADPPTISSGQSTTLSWSGTSGATYKLQYLDKDDNTVTITHVRGDLDQPLPSTGSYTIDDVERDTTFYLIVTMVVPGQDEPLKATRFFSVIVAPLPPVIEYFRPQGCTSSDCVIYADHFVLEWKIDNATAMQLTASDVTGTRVIEVPWKSTSTKITQTQNETEYVMTIQNKSDQQQQSTVNVTLIPPVLVGTIVSFVGAVNNLSAGWLNCNGQEVSGTTYPQLLALLGTTYGTPQTAGNVVLPNLNGVFLRGVDSAGAVDPDFKSRTSPVSGSSSVVGPLVGSRQWHQLLNHTHHWDKNFQEIGDGGNDIAVQLALNSNKDPDAGTQPTTLNDGGGSETRPVNVYVYYLIYGGIPQSPQQGQPQPDPPK
ncbi:MAG TPA: phage tail protein [Pyrinomonadaceae bacterium]|nr:phage tail protein [Pyrinomonadaceae bacterium]